MMTERVPILVWGTVLTQNLLFSINNHMTDVYLLGEKSVFLRCLICYQSFNLFCSLLLNENVFT